MIVSIDPGVNAMGVARWGSAAWRDKAVHLPMSATVFTANKKREWDDRIAHLLYEMEGWLSFKPGIGIEEVYCEMPVLFAGSVGHAAARRGDLTHLGFAVGAIAHWAWSIHARFYPVLVNDWIGQLPSEIKYNRIRNTLLAASAKKTVDKLLGPKPSHHWDAIGVGLYKQGKWR